MNKFGEAEYKYTLPYNFEENNPEFAAFKNFPAATQNDAEIKIFKNIRISNNSVAFRYFDIIRETCIGQEIYDKYKKGYKFYLKFIFPHINFSRNKRFILITDEWTTNYYHWHIIALHRLLVLKDNNLIEDSILLLPKKYKKLPFVLQSLEKFGIKKDQIIYLRRKSNIKVKELYFPLAIHNHAESLVKVKNIVNQNISNTTNFGDKIYISRGNSAFRKIINESEVLGLLERYGFKKLLMENFSYEDQISICANAKYIISPHGAGLTNILFMKDRGYILELGAAGKPVEKPVTDYYILASITNLNYLHQDCEIIGDITNDIMLAKALNVNLNRLEDNLKLMLNN